MVQRLSFQPRTTAASIDVSCILRCTALVVVGVLVFAGVVFMVIEAKGMLKISSILITDYQCAPYNIMQDCKIIRSILFSCSCECRTKDSSLKSCYKRNIGLDQAQELKSASRPSHSSMS